MKILYVITKSNWGGAQRHVFDLATAMKGKGHEVAVALGGDGILRTRLEEAGVYTHSIVQMGRDISPGRDAGSLRELFSVIRHRKPDLLHLHSPKAAGLGSLAGRLLGVKRIVYTVHGWAWNEDRSLASRAAIAFFSWLTMIFSHAIILISKREYDQTRLFPFVKEKLAVIPLGIQPPVFMSVDGAKQFMAKVIGMDLPEFNKRTAIVNIAELHPNKGLSYLIEAMALVKTGHPQAICIIVSEGQERSRLEAIIIRLGLEKTVYLAGRVDHAAEYLKAFNLFVLSSIKEGLPYTILEAGTASLPVIATTVGGIPELVTDMQSGVLVQPGNVRELAHAISYMIEHPDERKKYATALKTKVLEDFSLEKMVAGVEKIYSTPVPQTRY